MLTPSFTIIERKPTIFRTDPVATPIMSSGHQHLVHSASNGLSMNYDGDDEKQGKPAAQSGEGRHHVRLGEDKGLFTVKGMTVVWLWYFFSCVTLFLNKEILSTMKCDATLLGKTYVY